MTGAYHAISSSVTTTPLTVYGPRELERDTRSAARQAGGEFVVSRNDFQIRCATAATGERSHVSMLIRRLYAWRGLESEVPARFDERPNQITLVASRGDSTFGTVTLGLDTADGLSADHLYETEIEHFRRQGAKVCELTRLAIDPVFNSKEVLATIFHLAYIYARKIHGMTDLFIEVNPRHVSFYQRMFDFRIAGEERLCHRVNAPAVLLHLPFAHADAQIETRAGRKELTKSLYAQCFSPEEQAGLIRRIRANSVIAAMR